MVVTTSSGTYHESETKTATTGEGKSITVKYPYTPNFLLYGNYGWICPLCGRGVSPSVSICPCNCQAINWEVMC